MEEREAQARRHKQGANLMTVVNREQGESFCFKKGKRVRNFLSFQNNCTESQVGGTFSPAPPSSSLPPPLHFLHKMGARNESEALRIEHYLTPLRPRWASAAGRETARVLLCRRRSAGAQSDLSDQAGPRGLAAYCEAARGGPRAEDHLSAAFLDWPH